MSEALGSRSPRIPECYFMSSGGELTPRLLALWHLSLLLSHSLPKWNGTRRRGGITVSEVLLDLSTASECVGVSLVSAFALIHALASFPLVHSSLCLYVVSLNLTVIMPNIFLANQRSCISFRILFLSSNLVLVFVVFCSYHLYQ